MERRYNRRMDLAEARSKRADARMDRLEERMDKTGRRLDATVKLLQTGMKILVRVEKRVRNLTHTMDKLVVEVRELKEQQKQLTKSLQGRNRNGAH